MKKLAISLFLAVSCLTGSIPVSAQNSHSVYKEDPAARKLQKKYQKDMKKQLKKQKKAQDKMYRESVKKTHYPKHNY